MSDHAIATVDGSQLETILDEQDEAIGAIVLCHPHPEHGGTMRSPIIGAIAAAAVEARLNVLRFNFRGVGTSTGDYGGGEAEIRDVDAAVTFMSQRTVPMLGIAGWSFGAVVALTWTAWRASRLAYVGIAPPVDSPLTPTLPNPADLVTARRTLIIGDRDQFVPIQAFAVYAESIDAQLVRYPASDHFFVFKHEQLAADVVAGILPKPTDIPSTAS